MRGQYPHPVFLDATVLSNFASAGGISFLTALLEAPVVVPAVRTEMERGLNAGHEYLEEAVESIGDGLPVLDVPPDDEFRDLRERLDAGEAESMVGVIEHGGTVATDDLAARRVAKERSIPVTGSIGLLVLGVERGRVDRSTADRWLDAWREERGYYAPVEGVGEILDD